MHDPGDEHDGHVMWAAWMGYFVSEQVAALAYDTLAQNEYDARTVREGAD